MKMKHQGPVQTLRGLAAGPATVRGMPHVPARGERGTGTFEPRPSRRPYENLLNPSPLFQVGSGWVPGF